MTQDSTAQDTMTQRTEDPRPLHHRAMDQTGIIVAAVPPGQLSLPTPCTEYDVRALLSHIVGGLTRIAVVGEGGDGLAVCPAPTACPKTAGWPPTARPPPGPAPPGPTTQARRHGRGALGQGPRPHALGGYMQEILTHGWDLARATGQPTERDPGLAEWSLANARRILPPENRGPGIPFAPPVEPPADARPYTQLAAYLGRRP